MFCLLQHCFFLLFYCNYKVGFVSGWYDNYFIWAILSISNGSLTWMYVCWLCLSVDGCVCVYVWDGMIMCEANSRSKLSHVDRHSVNLICLSGLLCAFVCECRCASVCVYGVLYCTNTFVVGDGCCGGGV